MTVIARIIKPGLQTTLQDGGRRGFRHLGVSLSGGADALSLALANAAVGNSLSAPALECALTGPTLTFERNCAFALAGADMGATLNSEPIALYEAIEAHVGDRLAMETARMGARAYIAFRGGLEGDEFLSSVSTYLPGAVGGINGRALQAHDALLGAGLRATTPRNIPAALRPMLAHEFVLRASVGPDENMFYPGDIGRFFASTLTADRRGDRMGVKLGGFTLNAAVTGTMASGPVFPGTVQCPPDGAPFLLLADAQTTGGYPRIAQVIAVDLHLAGQIRSGDRIWFRKTSAEEALNIARERQTLMDAILPGFRYF